MRKIISIILCCIMFIGLTACNSGVTDGNTVTESGLNGKAIADNAVLDITIASHASWPYEEDWKVWEYIREGVGGTINVTAVPSSDFKTKFSLIMASPETLPDLIGFQNKPVGYSDYCMQGAFLALDDRPDLLPEYTKFWDSVPEEEHWMRDTRADVDGKVYFAPIYGMDRSTNIRAWLYRKDIFDKHGLKVPETMDELYSVSKELKVLYPESYPFCIRSLVSNLSVIGSSWKPGFCYGAYYDFENEKWCYGASEDTMYDIVVFLNKMVTEELAPADCFTIKATSWQELITTDRGFIMPDYQTRIDFFNNIAREKNPGFNMTAMIPPVASDKGIPMVNKHNVDSMAYSICNTGDEESIENAYRYINWMYSDAGELAVSWGKEGETFEVVDGKKQFILPAEGDSARSLYGFTTIGTYLRVDPEAADAFVSKEQAATTDLILEHTYEHLNPATWVAFTSEETTQKADYETSIKTFMEENIQKFIIGQKPLSEWDSFKEEMKELPLEELLSIYETAYNRVK
ncbi:MAG: extracellular solute-binding protein [Oscillospiraceae bacterium]|nr:extracellular solute-binding protein [Oscillospiraceae bacterium]MBQ9986261.1 extracellular solute-binding protein [Oscillospiraceae bacterium]